MSAIDRLPLQPIHGAAPDGDGLPYATHQGILKIPDGAGGMLEIEVVQLSTGQRVIPEDSVRKFFEHLGVKPTDAGEG